MEYQWEYSSGTYFHLSLMKVHLYMIANIRMVIISIHL